MISGEVKRLIAFNRELYLKNMIRVITYIMWFFMFIFGWFINFIDEPKELFVMYLGMNSAGFCIQGISFMNMKGNNEGVKNMPLKSFFGYSWKDIFLSRTICLVRYLVGLMAMAFIQTAVFVGAWSWGNLAMAELGIIGGVLVAMVMNLVMAVRA